MENMSFVEKLKLLWNTIISNKEVKFIIPILSIILLAVIISFFFKKKKLKRVYFIIYLVILSILFIMYYNPIINMLSYLFQTIVDNILIPNISLYLGMIIIANIIFIVIVINNNMNRFVKGVNVILFSFIQVFLFFIIKHIVNNNIDISSKITMDTNPQLLILIETSFFLFTLWCLFLLVIKLVNNIHDYKEDIIEINNVQFVSGYKVKLKSLKKKYKFDDLLVHNYDPNNIYDYKNEELKEFIPVKKKAQAK